jgi:cytochrome b561
MKSAAITHADVAIAPAARRRSVRTYRNLAKVLHWITAILVLMQVTSGVIMKQLNEGAIADLLFSVHKLTGALVLAVVLFRLSNRAFGIERAAAATYRHPFVHWMLYAIIISVPLLGWAGASAFGSLEIMPGYALPSIWPEGSSVGDALLAAHAYLAFALLALVALHVGNALHDYMTRSEG